MIENVETLSEAFVEYLEKEGIATFGQDLFLNRVPSSKKAVDSVYWVTSSGGNTSQKLKSGEIVRMHAIIVYFRASSGEEVEKKLHRLNELLTSQDCIELTGYETLNFSVVQFPTDQDLDVEDRQSALLRINIQTYKQRK